MKDENGPIRALRWSCKPIKVEKSSDEVTSGRSKEGGRNFSSSSAASVRIALLFLTLQLTKAQLMVRAIKK